MVVKFVALAVLIFSVKSDANEQTKNSLDRGLSSNCENSEPFLVKNRKKRKSYLTADLETNSVAGGKESGETNQQWIWSNCYDSGVSFSFFLLHFFYILLNFMSKRIELKAVLIQSSLLEESHNHIKCRRILIGPPHQRRHQRLFEPGGIGFRRV